MKSFFQKRKPLIVTVSIFLFYAIIFCSISLINHYNLRTYALDLGMFNHALYSFAQFDNPTFTLGLKGEEMPFLATHFSLLTALYSPFYYLFNSSYTLLFIQIISILAGGIGILKYSKEFLTKNYILTLIILVQFFSIWGIYSALSFDFHNNVIGAMLVVWLIYFIEKRNLKFAFIFLFLALFAKESMSYWLCFILLGLILKNRKQFSSEYKNFEYPALILCVIYGIAVIFFIMPSLQGSEQNLQYERYSHLGESFGEVCYTFISEPLYIISLLFENNLEDSAYDGIKRELHIMVIASGGVALIFRPIYLLMLIPIYFQKLLANDYVMWGINKQYSIEFVPILSFAFIDMLRCIKKFQVKIASIIAIITLGFNLSSIANRTSKWYKPENLQFYKKEHYTSDLNLKKIYKNLKKIDDNAALSVFSPLAPHLAFRNKIYHYPIVKDAKYIILLKNRDNTYPLSKKEFKSKIKKYKGSEKFKVDHNSSNLLIFKRK